MIEDRCDRASSPAANIVRIKPRERSDMSVTKIISSTRVHYVSAALLTAFLLSMAPASAQGNTVRQGVLTCRTSASVGLLVGSRQRLRCQFRSESAPDPELHRHHRPPWPRYRRHCRRRDGVGGAGEHAHHPVGRAGGRIRRRQRRHFGRPRRRCQPPGRRHAQIGVAAAVVGGRTGRRQSRARCRSHELKPVS